MAFSNGGAAITLISPDTAISGDLEFSGDLEIQGVVRGSIRARSESSGMVRVIEGGRVEGDIHAPRVVVNGVIEGDIHATEQLELAVKAQVHGNVHYQIIEIAKGAQINGSLIHGDRAPAVDEAVAGEAPTEALAALD